MTDLRFPFTCSAKKTLVAGLTLCLLCICGLARPVRAQDRDDEVLSVNTTLVQLNVGVVDRQGRAITNLTPADFTVYEDDVRQPITDFKSVGTPFSLILMLDMSGSTQPFRQTLKQAAYRFIDALAPEDRIAVVVFNEKVKTVARFTTDHRKIGSAIESADGKGETHFYDALNYSIRELAQEQNRRKAIVVLTDGVDTALRKTDRALSVNAHTNEEAIAAVKPETSATLNAVLNAADRQGVTIYPLALPSGDPKRLPTLEPFQVAIYSSARVRMQALANRTGGRLNEIRRLEDLGHIYAEVAADLRTLYTIAYQPSGARARDGRWRAIRIEVARPALIARTRPGYYAR
ncbi:MAG TPA: VWA domain-containing protein [Pyrinomonadaceae bacterium]|jgi:VWFA-related protein